MGKSLRDCVISVDRFWRGVFWALERKTGREFEFRVSGGSEFQSLGPMTEKRSFVKWWSDSMDLERTSESEDLVETECDWTHERLLYQVDTCRLLNDLWIVYLYVDEDRVCIQFFENWNWKASAQVFFSVGDNDVDWYFEVCLWWQRAKWVLNALQVLVYKIELVRSGIRVQVNCSSQVCWRHCKTLQVLWLQIRGRRWRIRRNCLWNVGND